MKKKYFRFLEWLRSRFPDPVYQCSLYKTEGCSHVDGLLCDFPDCQMNKNFEEEKKELKVYVYNHVSFDDYCRENNITDDNVENLEDDAFISIIGTPEVNEYYLENPNMRHWFEKDHPNVLNLEFDDVSCDNTFDYQNGKGEMVTIHAFAMSERQANKCVDFIESNLKKNFHIHCLAGVSRSQAIGCFIRFCYAEYMNAKQNPDNPCTNYNSAVLATLKRVWYRNNKIFS